MFLGNNNWIAKKYFAELEVKETYYIANLRLNMINVKDNRENNTKCVFREIADTSEHLFECQID